MDRPVVRGDALRLDPTLRGAEQDDGHVGSVRASPHDEPGEQGSDGKREDGPASEKARAHRFASLGGPSRAPPSAGATSGSGVTRERRDPLNDAGLHAKLEIAVSADGTLEKIGVVESPPSARYREALDNNNAQSGTGILGPYKGIESPEGLDKEDMLTYVKRGGIGIRDSQIDAMNGRRKADFVIMSAGINDSRFSSMMATCILYSDCANEPVAAPGGKSNTPLSEPTTPAAKEPAKS